MQEYRRRLTGDVQTRDEDEWIRDVLRTNLYGVDIKPASIDAHIQYSNRLIGERF